jgi:hypothetical protein
MSKTRPHLHDELIGRWCECGDGPFTRATWDDHRMRLLGALPVTRKEIEMIDKLDSPRTSRAELAVVEQRLTRMALGGSDDA